MQEKPYSLGVLGGTFDLFHKGHESFISTAYQYVDKLIIGLTSDKYVWEHKTEKIQPFVSRKKAIEAFLKRSKMNAEVVEIDDVYGPTLNPEVPFEAIMVTSDVEQGGLKVNVARRKKNLPELAVVLIPLEHAKNGHDLSSTRIRNGEIDRNGVLYLPSEIQEKTFELPDVLRPMLSRPFGLLIREFDEWIAENEVGLAPITIGDVVTKSFLSQDIMPSVAIVDLVVQREKRFHEISELGFEARMKPYRVSNPAGTITAELIQAVQKMIQKKKSGVIQVEGEEDLAVIPVLLAAPLGREIYYGQPHKGVVQVIASEEMKEKARGLLSMFKLKY